MPPFFVILWGYLGPVPPSPSYPIFVCTICKCLIFLVNLSSWFLYWVWFLWLSRPQLFGAYCAWIIGIFSSAGKLGIFFPFPKFHFDEFNSFYCVCPSFSHTYVLALLSFYVVCFCLRRLLLLRFHDCLPRVLLDYTFHFDSRGPNWFVLFIRHCQLWYYSQLSCRLGCKYFDQLWLHRLVYYNFLSSNCLFHPLRNTITLSCIL